MFILAKKTDTGMTLHGLCDDDAEMLAWQAAGQTVYEIDPQDTAQFDPYEPKVFG